MHAAESVLRIGAALRCSEPEQPPRLSKVYQTAIAADVQMAEHRLRIGVALRCSEPKQPPRLSRVY